MAKKLTTPAIRKLIFESLKKSKPRWYVTLLDGKYKQVADILIKNKRHRVVIKFRVGNGEYIRHGAIDKHSLSLMSQHSARHKKNLALVFIYYTQENKLISVDIDTYLSIKLNKISAREMISYGYAVGNWQKLDRYFDIMLGLKEQREYGVRHCVHHWLIESPQESYNRSRSRKHGMGYCKRCGKVRFDFANVIKQDLESNFGGS